MEILSFPVYQVYTIKGVEVTYIKGEPAGIGIAGHPLLLSTDEAIKLLAHLVMGRIAKAYNMLVLRGAGEEAALAPFLEQNPNS